MSDEPQPSASERAAGSDHPVVMLRVVPDSLLDATELEPSAWTRDAEQADWCVDAEMVLAAVCTAGGSSVSAMPARERRAIHLTRQRIRAQAILAAAEPGRDHERRERARRWAIVIGSAVLHAVGFVVLATAVADLQPRPRPDVHEHLFEARAVVPIEPAPAVARLDPPPAPAQPEQPPPARASAQPKRSKPAHAHDHTPASKPAPYQLRGFELSSQGELAAGDPGGESWGRPGGTDAGGADEGHDQGHASEPIATKPDVIASPRGGLLAPEYPPELERQGVEGSVLVKVWIDEHGHVIKAEVVESSHEESFDHNALMAAQRQDWTPAVREGEPVASTQRYRVHFRLR